LDKVRRLNAKVKKKVFGWFVKVAVGFLLAGMIFDRRFFAPEHRLNNLVFVLLGAAVLLVVYFFFIRSPDLDDDLDDEDEEFVPSEDPDWVKGIDWGPEPEEDDDDADTGFGWGGDGGYDSGGDGGGD